jgi:hypothetical protein
LEVKCVPAETKEHILGGVNTKKIIRNKAANFWMLVLKMAIIVFLQNFEDFFNLPFVAGVEQNVGHIIRLVLPIVAENGQGAIPRIAKLRLEKMLK